jgi:hypothetical protein
MRQKRATARFAASLYDGHFSDEDDPFRAWPASNVQVRTSVTMVPTVILPSPGRKALYVRQRGQGVGVALHRDAEGVM